VTPTAELLKRVTLFQTLPEQALAEIARLSTVRSVEEGGYYFMQGDEARYLYILTVGRVKLTQVTIDGQQVAMRMVGPEQMFAGAAILHPLAGYPVSAEAVEDSSALAWEASSFKSLSGKYPQLSFNLMQLMQAYILEMQSRYRELSTERVRRPALNRWMGPLSCSFRDRTWLKCRGPRCLPPAASWPIGKGAASSPPAASGSRL
jgi:CRP-like cAMP-binding protein